MQAAYIKTLVLVFWYLLPGQVLAQQETPDLSRLSFGVQVGLLGYGPSHRVYSHMNGHGFGKTGGYFSIKYPRKGQLTGAFAIRYKLADRFSVKGVFSLLNSWVVGHDSFRRWRVDMDVVSPALIGLFHNHDQSFYIGTGPSLNFVQFHSTRFTSTNTHLFQDKFQKMGWVIESGLQFPANTRFFADVQLRYALVGKKKEGPFLFQGQSLWSDLNGANAPDRMVPALDIAYHNLLINVGGGMRVGRFYAR